MTRTYAKFGQNISYTDYQCKNSALFVYFLKRLIQLQSGKTSHNQMSILYFCRWIGKMIMKFLPDCNFVNLLRK
eukprot:UN04699